MTFQEIREKALAGERISAAEALYLYESCELLDVGELAATLNGQQNGAEVLFNVNRHINHTNICVNRCAFCAFSRTGTESDAYTYSLEEVRRRAEEALQQGATEIHVVGGLHPDLPFTFYLDLLRTIRDIS